MTSFDVLNLSIITPSDCKILRVVDKQILVYHEGTLFFGWWCTWFW